VETDSIFLHPIGMRVKTKAHGCAPTERARYTSVFRWVLHHLSHVPRGRAQQPR